MLGLKWNHVSKRGHCSQRHSGTTELGDCSHLLPNMAAVESSRTNKDQYVKYHSIVLFRMYCPVGENNHAIWQAKIYTNWPHSWDITYSVRVDQVYDSAILCGLILWNKHSGVSSRSYNHIIVTGFIADVKWWRMCAAQNINYVDGCVVIRVLFDVYKYICSFLIYLYAYDLNCIWFCGDGNPGVAAAVFMDIGNNDGYKNINNTK